MSSSDVETTRFESLAARRKVFFYAELESDVYDVAADLNTPLYSLMQETLLALVSNYISSTSLNNEEITILDIGSGTGAESIALLEMYPESKVVALDLCEPMHRIYRDKLVSSLGEDALKRVQFLTCDIVGEEAKAENLLNSQRKISAKPQYDIVISALTLHHLTVDEKYAAYERIAQVLSSKGLLVNADIFSYRDNMLAEQSSRFTLDWIQKQFTTPDLNLVKQQQALGTKATYMREAWIKHCQEDNIPDPIFSPLDDKNAQANMLKKLGFSSIECPFRFWEIGILWAIK